MMSLSVEADTAVRQLPCLFQEPPKRVHAATSLAPAHSRIVIAQVQGGQLLPQLALDVFGEVFAVDAGNVAAITVAVVSNGGIEDSRILDARLIGHSQSLDGLPLPATIRVLGCVRGTEVVKHRCLPLLMIVPLRHT